MAVTATARFVPNLAGIAAIARSQQVMDDLMELADEAAVYAKGVAPVDDGDDRDGIETEGTVDGGEAVALIVARDWKSGFIEFGASSPTYTTPAHAPLRRGAEQAGLKIEDK
jgi:hypothetical protein